MAVALGNVTTMLQNEISARLSAEAQLSTFVILLAHNEEKNMTKAVQTEMSRAVVSETLENSLRVAADNTLSLSVSLEASTRIVSDNTLSRELQDEASRASAAEVAIKSFSSFGFQQLSSALVTGESSTISKLSLLSTDIQVEKLRATAAEISLNSSFFAGLQQISSAVQQIPTQLSGQAGRYWRIVFGVVPAGLSHCPRASRYVITFANPALPMQTIQTFNADNCADQGNIDGPGFGSSTSSVFDAGSVGAVSAIPVFGTSSPVSGALTMF